MPSTSLTADCRNIEEIVERECKKQHSHSSTTHYRGLETSITANWHACGVHSYVQLTFGARLSASLTSLEFHKKQPMRTDIWCQAY